MRNKWRFLKRTLSFPAAVVTGILITGVGAASAAIHIEAESFSAMSGVTTETCADAGGGQNIGFINSGDKATYPGIDLTGMSGFYARASSGSQGGTIEIHLDSATGATIGTCIVKNTGGWDAWITMACSLSTVSGTHDLCLVFSGTDPFLFNINWFRLDTVALARPGVFSRFEAEIFDSMAGVQLGKCTDTGSGATVGYIENGDYVIYKNLDLTGSAGFFARVSSLTAGGFISIQLDSITGDTIGRCKVKSSGSWDTWTTAACSLKTVTGRHDLCLVFSGESGFLFNFNWFVFDTVPPSIILPVRNAFDRIEAETLDSMAGLKISACADSGNGAEVQYVENGDYAIYKNCSFANATGFRVRVSSFYSGGSIEIRLDSITGTLIGTCAVKETGLWKYYGTDVAALTETVTGTHDVCLVFRGGGGFLCNVNWFQFSPTVPVKTYAARNPLDTLEAETFDSASISGIARVTTTDESGTRDVEVTQNNTFVVYKNIDLSGIKSLYARVNGLFSGGCISVRIDSIDGPTAGTCQVGATNGWFMDSCTIRSITGSHDVFLVFNGPAGAFLQLNWCILSNAHLSYSVVSRIEAENYDSISGASSVIAGPVSSIGDVQNGDYVAYTNVDFTGAGSFTAATFSRRSGSIGLYIDSLTGTLIGTCEVLAGDGSLRTDSCMLSDVSGSHTVFLVFKGAGGDTLFNLEWFKFGIPLVPVAANPLNSGRMSNGIHQSGPAIFITKEPQLQGVVELFTLSGRRVIRVVMGKGETCYSLTREKMGVPRGAFVVKLSFGNRAPITARGILQ